jgi:hypothetical protein
MQKEGRISHPALISKVLPSSSNAATRSAKVAAVQLPFYVRAVIAFVVFSKEDSQVIINPIFLLSKSRHEYLV